MKIVKEFVANDLAKQGSCGDLMAEGLSILTRLTRLQHS